MNCIAKLTSKTKIGATLFIIGFSLCTLLILDYHNVLPYDTSSLTLIFKAKIYGVGYLLLSVGFLIMTEQTTETHPPPPPSINQIIMV